MLNHPGESLVLQSDFLYMVERVDICIDYLKAHVRPSRPYLILSLLIPTTAPLPRSRDISPQVQPMHDSRDDAHQDVLHHLLALLDRRRVPPNGREGAFLSFSLSKSSFLPLSRTYPKQLSNTSSTRRTTVFLRASPRSWASSSGAHACTPKQSARSWKSVRRGG